MEHVRRARRRAGGPVSVTSLWTRSAPALGVLLLVIAFVVLVMRLPEGTAPPEAGQNAHSSTRG